MDDYKPPKPMSPCVLEPSKLSRKNSLFSYKGLTSIILTLLAFLEFVQLLSKASYHASQLCMCLCVYVYGSRRTVKRYMAEYRDRATCDLVAT